MESRDLKKKYILKIIDTLGDLLPNSGEIRKLVDDEETYEVTLDAVIAVVNTAISKAKNATGKAVLTKGLTTLQKIKEQEVVEEKENAMEIEKLEEMMKGLE